MVNRSLQLLLLFDDVDVCCVCFQTADFFGCCVFVFDCDDDAICDANDAVSGCGVGATT